MGLASLFTLVFGILAVAGEYRHQPITETCLSTPARGPVIGAKLLVYAVLGTLAGVLSSLVDLGAASAPWSARGASFAWADSAMWTTIGGGIAWNAAFGAIGVGVGALVRSLLGAIATALTWVALVDGIIGQLIGDLARWLRFNAGQALGTAAEPMMTSTCWRAGAAVLSCWSTHLPARRRPSAPACDATCSEPAGADFFESAPAPYPVSVLHCMVGTGMR